MRQQLGTCVFVLAAGLMVVGCSEESRAITAAQDAVKRELNDPYSARFERVRYIAPKPGTFVSHVCGFVNAKNAFGAYVGMRPFAGKVIGNQAFTAVLQKRGDWYPYRDYFTPCGISSDPFTF
jgi:hypothetical protein